jgi:hypothetical protein
MGNHRENGDSATVEGFFITQGERIRVAKSNGCAFVRSEPREMPPDTEGDLLVIVDGEASSRRVTLPDGSFRGQRLVRYKVVAPF